MEGRLPYDDYPVVFLPPYESPPAWVPPHERVYHPDYNNELTQFLPRTIVLKKPPGAQLGFNIRGGKASQLGIFISKVIPDSDAHRAGLQEGDQVLSVNDVDFQDIEHSKAVEILKTAREITMRIIRDRRKELFTNKQLPAGASPEWLCCKTASTTFPQHPR
ncbi:PDZ domain-containing protein 11 isoform X1 [Apteryx mantelli]|uniref:PDZ domain-containing protein 11 isoform X1 n=1 Tax=Apteryx mantelli TaxID=2696672 RepID=A0ABM4F551_9AVES